MENGVYLPTEHLKSARELVPRVSVHSGTNWNLSVLVFDERGKLEYPEENLSEQGDNQQQTQPTYDAGTSNRTVGQHWWEASALTTAPPLPCIPFLCYPCCYPICHPCCFETRQTYRFNHHSTYSYSGIGSIERAHRSKQNWNQE